MDARRRLKPPKPGSRLKPRQKRLLLTWLALVLLLNLLGVSGLQIPLFARHILILLQLIPLDCFLLSFFRDPDSSSLLRLLSLLLLIISLVAFIVPLSIDLLRSV